MADNVGRGGVIKHLWTLATGDIYVHQDADLEYDPQDYIPLLAAAPRRIAPTSSTAAASRDRSKACGWLNRMGNLTMTGAARALYGAQVSDLMTCYKMYRSSLINGLQIEANGFDFEAEFTARLAQRGARFAEVPVSFRGRTFEEGKKIRAFDAVRVMRELVRCKVTGEAALADLDGRMVGVILAAGKGARMYPFSERSPKPILPILNRPLLAHQIEVMRDCGIADIHIVVGHLGYQVASAFGDGSQLRRPHPLRRAGKHARPRARGRRARIARPAAVPADARRHLLPPEGAAAAADRPGAVAARSTPTWSACTSPIRRWCGAISSSRPTTRGRVQRVIEKPRYVDSQLKGCGLYVFDPHIFDAIRRTPRTAMRDEYEITDSIQILINDGYVVAPPPDRRARSEPDQAGGPADDQPDRARAQAACRSWSASRVRCRRRARGSSAASSARASSSAIRSASRTRVIMPSVIVDASTDLDSVVMDGEHTVYCPGVAAQRGAQSATHDRRGRTPWSPGAPASSDRI